MHQFACEGAKVADLATAGIRYIELRNIDINPFEMYGIFARSSEISAPFLVILSNERGRALMPMLGSKKEIAKQSSGIGTPIESNDLS